MNSSSLTEDRVREIVHAELNGCTEVFCWLLIIVFVVASFIVGQWVSHKKMYGLEQRIGVLEAGAKAEK